MTATDSQQGIALVNETSAVFAWRDDTNQTYTINFESSIPLGVGQDSGVLLIISDRIQLPEDVASKINITTSQHFVFQDSRGINYVLTPVQ